MEDSRWKVCGWGFGYTLEGAGDCDDRANDFRRKSVLFLQIFFGSVRHHDSANPLWILNLSLVRNFLSHANTINIGSCRRAIC